MITWNAKDWALPFATKAEFAEALYSSCRAAFVVAHSEAENQHLTGWPEWEGAGEKVRALWFDTADCLLDISCPEDEPPLANLLTGQK
jgi:hypothetical protein